MTFTPISTAYQWRQKTEAGAMVIEHYSTEPGLEVLRPQAGPDFPGNGGERRRAKLPDYLPRWYGYLAGTEAEVRMRSRPHVYTVTVETSSVYDLEEDPEDFSQIPDLTGREAAIKAAGYVGYRVRNIVAIFYAVPCTERRSQS